MDITTVIGIVTITLEIVIILILGGFLLVLYKFYKLSKQVYISSLAAKEAIKQTFTKENISSGVGNFLSYFLKIYSANQIRKVFFSFIKNIF